MHRPEGADGHHPLVVDLDGTLVKADLLHESLTVALLKQPRSCHRIFAWLAKGRAHLKARLAEAVTLDPATLPYRADLLGWLKQEKAKGRRIVLATAANHRIASTVADHLGLFDEVVSSDENVNLKSAAKRDALVGRYGLGGFAYVGNARADLPVWQAASRAHVAGHAPQLTGLLRDRGRLGKVFDEPTSMLSALLQAMRPAQWAKNLLILVPLLMAHLLFELGPLATALLATVVFSLAASGVYILNDLVDLQDDRHHPRKRLRPFASGALPVAIGWVCWPALLLMAAAASLAMLPAAFTGWLAAYLALTLAYSLWLKRKPIVDVVTLALLYTVRLIAGAAAIAVPLSFWLLSFSIFVFLSLALVKRYSELRTALVDEKPGQLRGRGYGPSDLNFVAILGGSAGYTSVLVLALYIQDPRTASLYASTELIWPACPIFLFWISRFWLLACRGEIKDDPVVFAVQDRTSWLIAAMLACTFALASWIK
ncbi:hypothetical protein UC35_18295 [Ramlibacter tataouinensis]|uniref:Uncharacterized protein n=1 Tax=Ramlibacter tataouinensis TaxID=94132 RepID=A0A127K030_9BURK|nr:hypothetical protein UC35_18295 [Ramlibacter tataouinensis]